MVFVLPDHWHATMLPWLLAPVNSILLNQLPWANVTPLPILQFAPTHSFSRLYARIGWVLLGICLLSFHFKGTTVKPQIAVILRHSFILALDFTWQRRPLTLSCPIQKEQNILFLSHFYQFYMCLATIPLSLKLQV